MSGLCLTLLFVVTHAKGFDRTSEHTQQEVYRPNGNAFCVSVLFNENFISSGYVMSDSEMINEQDWKGILLVVLQYSATSRICFFTYVTPVYFCDLDNFCPNVIKGHCSVLGNQRPNAI
jgi:hypothetical protein